jgi:hypothetical protein
MLTVEEETNLRDTYEVLPTERLVQLTKESGLTEDASRILLEEIGRREEDVSRLAEEIGPPRYETHKEYLSEAILQWLSNIAALFICGVPLVLGFLLIDFFRIPDPYVVVLILLLAPVWFWTSWKVYRWIKRW